MSASNPENTVFDAKRLIGRDFSDATVKDMEHFPFSVTADKNNKPVINVTYKGEKKFSNQKKFLQWYLQKWQKKLLRIILEQK